MSSKWLASADAAVRQPLSAGTVYCAGGQEVAGDCDFRRNGTGGSRFPEDEAGCGEVRFSFDHT